jgi:S-adenosylmethionine:tRNA ribosyltransferase-isomerase
MTAATSLTQVEAFGPPEAHGDGRDDVALLVASGQEESLVHAHFRELPRFLNAGDVLVVNVSATVPAALDAGLAGERVELRLSTPLADGTWLVELRTPDRRPHDPPPAGARIDLPGEAWAESVGQAGGRFAFAQLHVEAPIEAYLQRHGRPVTYPHVQESWPIDAYQTVFAREPGSAEMPSAARPFTTELVTSLVAGGVLFAPILLHTGLSSPERGEEPYPERFRMSPESARLVNAVRWWGGRVIAVGTTAVRALETVTDANGTVYDGSGWTDLVITPERGLRAVDGLLTGWHEPESSHLQLLEAAAGADLLDRSYRAALENGYRWHEFGDLHLILP